MRPIQLTSDLELGYPAIDDQHRALLSLADEVNQAVEAGLPEPDVALRIAALIAATDTHFRSEEGLMLTSGFDHYEAHKSDHDHLLEQIQAARQNIESGVIPPSELLDFFICAWATHHIAKFDLEFVEHLKSLPPS